MILEVTAVYLSPVFSMQVHAHHMSHNATHMSMQPHMRSTHPANPHAKVSSSPTICRNPMAQHNLTLCNSPYQTACAHHARDPFIGPEPSSYNLHPYPER